VCLDYDHVSRRSGLYWVFSRIAWLAGRPADSRGLKSGAASCMAHRLRDEGTWGKRTAGYSPTSRYSNMSGREMQPLRRRNSRELMASDFDPRLN
jgi:hypothetical protein